MSSKPGDSFEARIALLLHSAGLQVKEQPHVVYLNGKNVGDLDVLAIDINTSTLIGVSCKEYLSGAIPGSQHFSHFVQMLEYENIKHGIFASATTVADTFQSLIDYQKQKGKFLIVLTEDDIKQLESLVYSNQKWEVEDYFRTALGLETKGKTTIGHVLRAQRSVTKGRMIEIDSLIPMNYLNELPSYIENQNILIQEIAELRLDPYLVFQYNLSIDIRHPGTGQVLEDCQDEGTVIVNAVSGKKLEENDPLYEHIEKNFTHAEIQTKLQEDGFTIKKIEPAINVKEFVNIMRREIASENEIEANYTTVRGDYRTVTKRPRPDDVKLLSRPIVVYVPIWNVKFTAGNKSYNRIYFAYDGKVIQDDLQKCNICDNSTEVICDNCYSTTCQVHRINCKICQKITCSECGHNCVVCKTGFCNEHTPEQRCNSCSGIVCENCAVIACTECKVLVCKNDIKIIHRLLCKICNRVICSNCGKSCIDCNAGFCPGHFPATHCGKCMSILCDKCAMVTCHECNMLVCSKHINNCPVCRKITCGSHEVTKRYSMFSKNFCSQECMNNFDIDYQSLGRFGKLKKLVK